MNEPAAPRHFRRMAGQRYELGPMTLAFKPCEAEVDCVYSSPGRVFEAFAAEVSSANRDSSIDVHAVFARHGFELLASEPEQTPSARPRVEVRR